jgi:hypothetical protein
MTHPTWQTAALLLLALWLPAATVSAGSDPALDLVKRVYDRPSGRDVAQRAVMTLTQRGQQPRERVLYAFYLKGQGRERKSLIRFESPPDVQDTALLTHDHAGDASEQWLFLPALKRERRISSSRKGGRFVGSDFVYEDLQDREPESDHHRLLGADKVGGLACQQLESIPVSAKDSVYGKRISCIHTGILLPLQVEFYPPRGKTPSKRLKVLRVQKIQGYWTATDTRIEDLASGHATRLQ